MDDNTLKSYLPAYGDRVSVIALCKCKRDESNDDNSKALLELRGKWKRNRTTARCSGFKMGNSCAERKTRRLELGWMDFCSQSKEYKQVRQTCGGGVRHLTVQKSLRLKEVLKQACDTFFPLGISQRGILPEFETELKDFQGMCVDMEKTVNDHFEESKLKILRVYLYTKMKTVQVYREIVCVMTYYNDEWMEWFMHLIFQYCSGLLSLR